MIAYKDYKSYHAENQNLIELLHENCPIIYDRIKDCNKVLEYIGIMYERKQPIDEDFINIFETGFSYLHEQIELIKLYYNEYFKRDLILFKHYEVVINYLLYIDDFGEALSEKGYYTKQIESILRDLSNELDNILKKRNKFTNEDLERFNTIIESCAPHKVELLTTDVIFSYILEELE